MRFQKRYRPELVAAKPNRHVLEAVRLDCEEKKLVATDGHRLVAIPVEVDKGDESASLSLESLKCARAYAGIADDIEIRVNGAAEIISPLFKTGPVFEKYSEQKYPDWKNVLPKFKRGDAGTVSIALNPELLVGLAKAMDAGKAIRLVVSADKGAPILVEPTERDNGATGLLMPLRDDP